MAADGVSQGIGDCRQPVSGVVGKLGLVLFGIGFFYLVVVFVVGMGQGVSGCVPAGQDVVHLVVGEGGFGPFLVGDGNDVACRIDFVGDGFSCGVGAACVPAVCVVSPPVGLAQGIGFRQCSVHGVVGVAPGVSGSVCYG